MKKFLALVLAMLMVVSAAATVSAFDDVAADDLYYDAITDLNEKGIITGWDEATFGPDGAVTRWQMALMLVKAITGKTNSADWEKGMARFTDVMDGQYNGAIYRAAALGIIEGVGDGLYEPERGVTYAEALTMIVRALNWDKQDKCLDKDGNVALEWPWDYIDIAEEKGLTEDVDVIDIDAPLTRAETAQVIFNLIYAPRYDVDTKKTADNTFAEEKFNVAGKKNTTYFILTETKKLGTTNIDADFKGEYVQITDYADNTKSYTVKATALGFKDAAEADAFYKYGVKAVNFDANKVTFASAEIVEPTVVNQYNVTFKAPDKLVINGKTYYLGTGTDALKNYITVDTDWTTETAAEAADFGGIYQVSFFDYDNDGKLDKGYKDIVKVGVYPKTTATDKYVYLDGNDFKAAAKDVVVTGSKKAQEVALTFSTELAEKDVFTYVVNTNTNTVDVIEVAEQVTGKVAKRSNASFTELVDSDVNGKLDAKLAFSTYTIGDATYKRVDNATNTVKYGFAPADNTAVTDISALGGDEITLGKEYVFTVLGGTIYKVEKVAAAAKAAKNYGIIASALKEVGDYFFADMYIGGKKVTDVEIAKYVYNDGSKDVTVTVADAESYMALQNAIDKYKATYEVGDIVVLTELEDGSYSIKETTLGDEVTAEYLTDSTSADGYMFASGIGQKKADGNAISNADRDTMLLTDANTIFYFIVIDGSAKSIKVFNGKPADNSVLPANATVYVDKLGYFVSSKGNDDVAGTTGLAFVEINKVDTTDVAGFGNIFVAASETYKTVYINNKLDKTAYDVVLGSEIGYTDAANKDAEFLKFTGANLAINMKDGSLVTTIYAKDIADVQLGNAGVVTINSKGVIETGTGVNVDTSKTYKKGDIFQMTYITTDDGDFNSGTQAKKATKIYAADGDKLVVVNTIEEIDAILGANANGYKAAFHSEEAYVVIVFSAKA